MQTNECESVPITFHLPKQAVGLIWLTGQSWPTPTQTIQSMEREKTNKN